MTIERRAFQLTELRTKHDAGLTIVGHAAVFNSLSEDLGGFREKISPGAFAQSIENDDIRALWNHDPNYPLARNKSGTLRLHEDDKGLAIEADLVDEPFERSLVKKIERGDVSQMSFGFLVPPKGDDWRYEDGGIVRTLNKVQLFDVSPVTFPAYPQTDVSNARFAEQIAEVRRLQEGIAPKSVAQSSSLTFLSYHKQLREKLNQQLIR
jgi:hypothetical protein